MRRPGERRGQACGSSRTGIERGEPMKHIGWGLRVYLRSDRGRVFGTTLLAAGAAPPTVGLLAQPDRALTLMVQCDTAGDTDAGATYKWSIDGGINFVETLQPINEGAVGLGDTGIILNFPIATFATDCIYRGTCATWQNQALAATYDFANGTAAAQFLMEHATFGGMPGMSSDGVDDVLFSTTLAQDLDGTDAPMTAMVALDMLSTVLRRPFAMGAGGGTTARQDFGTGGTLIQCRKVDDSGAGVTSTQGPSPNIAVGKHVFEYVHHGTTQTLACDGVYTINGAACDVGATTMDRAVLSATYLAGTTTVYAYKTGEYQIYNQALPQDVRRRLRVRQASLFRMAA